MIYIHLVWITYCKFVIYSKKMNLKKLLNKAKSIRKSLFLYGKDAKDFYLRKLRSYKSILERKRTN